MTFGFQQSAFLAKAKGGELRAEGKELRVESFFWLSAIDHILFKDILFYNPKYLT